MSTFLFRIDRPGSDLHGEEARFTSHSLAAAQLDADRHARAINAKLVLVGQIVNGVFTACVAYDDLPHWAQAMVDTQNARKLPPLRKGQFFKRRTDGVTFEVTDTARGVRRALLRTTGASGWYDAEELARDFERVEKPKVVRKARPQPPLVGSGVQADICNEAAS